jgi:hypothetical protein
MRQTPVPGACAPSRGDRGAGRRPAGGGLQLLLQQPDIGSHVPSRCVVVAQVQNGQWARAYPSKPGTFDCSSSNIATVKMNITM